MEKILSALRNKAKQVLKSLQFLTLKKNFSEGFTSVHDLPIHNFFEFFKDGQLTWLTKKGKPSIDYYYAIMDSFNKEIGFANTYKDELKDKKRLLKLQASYLIKQERTLLNEIEQLEMKIFAEKSVNKIKIDDTLPIVIKEIGYFDKKKMSTYDYYKILGYIKK